MNKFSPIDTDVDYARYLSRSRASIYLDQKTFEDYRKGAIELTEAFKRFLYNNNYENGSIPYNEQRFEKFVKGLGYGR